MKFGQEQGAPRVGLQAEEGFPLPPVSERSRENLIENRSRLAISAPAAVPLYTPVDLWGHSVFLGGPIWGHAPWVGKIYPAKTKSTDFLHWYAKFFDAIELNSSHYRTPSLSQVDKWVEQTPSGFRFCPKLPQEISHWKKLEACEEPVARFALSLERLGDRLGVSFLQMPPNFGIEGGPLLARFLSRWPKAFRIGVELRHPSWFVDGQLHPRLEELLIKVGSFAVVSDTLGKRETLHGGWTASVGMVRFLGNELHPSDYVRIDAWKMRLRELSALGAKETYFFIHQPVEDTVPEIAWAMRRGAEVPAPWNVPVEASAPIQTELFT